MIAELAKEDYNDLKGEGLSPTLEDFDRLNQLALRIERGAETTAANAPRIGWVDDVPFYEPTVAALQWLYEFAYRVNADTQTYNSFFYFACAHARKVEVFKELENPKAIEKAVKKWLKSLPCTAREIDRACMYAAYGFDDAKAAKTPMRKKREAEAQITVEGENARRLEELVASSLAHGIRYLDLLASTPSRLNAMIISAQIEAGLTLSRDVVKMQVDYTYTLQEIRERLIAEKEAHDVARD